MLLEVFVRIGLIFGIFLQSGYCSISNNEIEDYVIITTYDNFQQFSSSYSAEGTLHIPYAEISEPFFAWYNPDAGSSRIDYYGGMVKTYQLSKSGSYGTSIKIAPMTTETVLNQMTCFQVNGTKDAPVGLQAILPVMDNFKYIGDEVVRGRTCQKWQYINTVDDKVNKYTMWIDVEPSTKTKQGVVYIPVRYEMKGLNSLLGSHYDHYYLDYDYFSIEAPKPEVFEVPANLTCGDFPGPGISNVATFNPMHEFIHNDDSHVETAFDQFKRTHHKNYTDHKEHEQRKNTFRQNLRYIYSTNRASLGFQLGTNHLADWTTSEMMALRGRTYSPGYNGGKPFPYKLKDYYSVPDTMDWRLYGAVTPVKDQSVCGSCWSFGTTGTLEGAHFLKTGNLVRLSQQALIDCSWGYGNNGCDGGEDFRSYQWMMKHGGIPSEDSYGQYMGMDGFCHFANASIAASIKGYVNVTSGDQDALKLAISKHGPISVGIDASHKSFSFYVNGIYYDPQCASKPDQLDHAVLAVGYGTINGKEYWLVKNSWSTYWGNDGYVLMSLKDNNCGVATSPTYVEM